MSGLPDWLPPFLELADFDGNWQAYEDAVYQRFLGDLVTHRVLYRGIPVHVRYHPPTYGKGYGFWHCVQEGAIEAERTPDFARCARIGWIRAIIEHAGSSDIDEWTNVRGREKCHLLWFREEYLVVLAERGPAENGRQYMLLKTAYCTEREHRRQKLRAERDSPING